MIVCHCAVVNDAEIRSAIVQGATSVPAVAGACGAGSFCGGCVRTIARLLSEQGGLPPNAYLGDGRSATDGPARMGSDVHNLVHGIERQLVDAGWPVGEPLATIDQLAAAHGASTSAVRRALTVLDQRGTVQGFTGRESVLLVGRPVEGAVLDVAALYLDAAQVTTAEIAEARTLVELVPEETVGRAGSRSNPMLGLLRRLLAGNAGHPRVAAPGSGAGKGISPLVREGRTAWSVATAFHSCFPSGDHEPGHAIGNERDVRERLGVTRAVWHAALPLIEFYGLATRQPATRPTVAISAPDPWPAAQLMALFLDFEGVKRSDLLTVREFLEVRAAELAADRIDADGVTRLSRRLAEEVALRSQMGHLAYSTYHNIHPLLAGLSGNRVIALTNIAVTLALVRHAHHDVASSTYLGHGPDEISRAHAEIVERVIAGDSRGSGERMRRHIARHTMPPAASPHVSSSPDEHWLP